MNKPIEVCVYYDGYCSEFDDALRKVFKELGYPVADSGMGFGQRDFTFLQKDWRELKEKAQEQHDN